MVKAKDLIQLTVNLQIWLVILSFLMAIFFSMPFVSVAEDERDKCIIPPLPHQQLSDITLLFRFLAP